MTTYQTFLLGLLVIYTPGLIFLAFMSWELWRVSKTELPDDQNN